MRCLQGSARISVPATSANLGPGFDCLGVALELRDEYSVEVVDEPGVTVKVIGEGAGDLPTDETNLVALSLLRCLERFGVDCPKGLRVTCHNRIPHGCGLGSSSAAIVGGLALARELCPDANRMPDYALLEFATELEGHPDNVAPALLGGFTLSWTEDRTGHAVRLTPHREITPVVAIAPTSLSTQTARSVLPDSVPFDDAVFNISRSALLCHALTTEPELLLPATADRMHQDQRAPAYVDSYHLVASLREHGRAAAVSGAGPTVIVLAHGDADAVVDDVQRAAGNGWRVEAMEFAMSGVGATARAA